MATQTLISEADYLAAHYDDPVPEYVCGELVERAMPDNAHSGTQTALIVAFGRADLHLFLRSELRVRVAPRLYRIADLLIYENQPTERLPVQIPLAAIEIVSPDDRHEEIMSKLADYETWGVPHVWLVDPGLRRLSVYSKGSLTAVPALELPERSFKIDASEILG